MPKLIASSLSKDDFESIQVGGSVPVAPESSETASIPVTVEWRNITLNAEVGNEDIMRKYCTHFDFTRRSLYALMLSTS